MSIRRQEKSNRSQFRSDLGLLEGTFIRPTGPRMPSFFTEPRRRVRIEWHWARNKFQSLFMLFSYKFLIKKRKPRPKLERKKIGINAQRLHSQMYTALAEGDLAQLRRICTEGILASFRVRINTRPKGEINRWTLHKYVDSFYSLTPRIVSTRIAKLPMDESVVMQVVVKVKSTQSLQKLMQGKEDTVIRGPGDGPKTLVEYVVMQRMMIEGEEKSWMIWGTTHESKVEDVLREENSFESPAIGNHESR